MAGKPQFVRIMEAIGLTPTKGVERAMLLASTSWADFDTGEFWPSLQTWAERAGVGETTARRAARGLQSKHLIRAIKNSKGGIGPGGRGLSVTYQLLPLSGLWEPKPEATATLDKPGRSGRKGGRSGTQTRPETTVNPAAAAPKPSKQLPAEQTTQPPHEPGSHSSAGVCLDGRTRTEKDQVRQMLARLGVKGPKLAELVGCDLKAVDVEREIADIASDPSILNPAGVLVSRLSPSSNTSRALLKSLPADEQSLIRSLGAARQRHLRSEPATRVGSVAALVAREWADQIPQAELGTTDVELDREGDE